MSETSSLAPSAEEILQLHQNFTTTPDADRVATYRSRLSEYAAELIADICTRKVDQWELFSYLEQSIVLFSFSNHQRLCFSRRGDRLVYKFRTQRFSKRLSSYSFRCLWTVQSPVFHEILTNACPLIDKGAVYLTFSEILNTFFIRLTWDSNLHIPAGETLVQNLVEYNLVPRQDVHDDIQGDVQAV